jgi:hypothetical protein
VSLATGTSWWRSWRGGVQACSGEHTVVASKRFAARAAIFYGEAEVQKRKGRGAPGKAGRVEPELGGAPAMAIATGTLIRALPKLERQCYSMEVV